MKKEIEVGKESAEIFEAVAELIKAGKSGGVAEMMKHLPAVAVAIEGISSVGEEAKAKSVYMTCGYGAGLIAEAVIA